MAWLADLGLSVSAQATRETSTLSLAHGPPALPDHRTSHLKRGPVGIVLSRLSTVPSVLTDVTCSIPQVPASHRTFLHNLHRHVSHLHPWQYRTALAACEQNLRSSTGWLDLPILPRYLPT